MKLVLVGVGQVFDFATGQMVDQLQVEVGGRIVSVPAAQETVQALIDIAMNGQPPQPESPRMAPMPASQPLPTAPKAGAVGDDIPEGASVFGGEMESNEETLINDEDQGEVVELEHDSSGFRAVDQQQAAIEKAQRSLGRTRNASDRSGVPSYGISRVDSKGNPVLPPPDLGEDEEDDPGEQI